MKICFFNTACSWGGGEKWHFDMAFYSQNNNIPTLIITNKIGELYKKVKSNNLAHRFIKISNLSFLNVFTIISLAKIFKQEKISVLVVNLSSDLKAAGIAARLAGIKRIIYRRGSAIPIRNSLFNRFLFKYIVDEILANSEETKRTINQNNASMFPENKIRVIYNGINLDCLNDCNSKLLYNRNTDEVIIGNVGRLVQQKGQLFLIALAKELKYRNIKFKILIAGDGPLKEALIEKAKTEGVEDVIIFLGFVENIKSFMDSIDIFVLSSLWEGFGYVLVEAMANCKPIVAFNVSSNPEIVSDNETGYLTPVGDIKAFSSAIEKLIFTPGLIESYGKAGRKIAESKFDSEQTFKIVSEFLSVNYKKAI